MIKIVFLIVLAVAICTVNYWIINGPLLTQNIDISMRQFKDVPATAGDIEIAGSYISFSVVYIVEVILWASVAALLFLSNVKKLTRIKSNERKN